MANLQRLCNKNYDVYDGNKKVNDHNFYKFFFLKKKHFFFFFEILKGKGAKDLRDRNGMRLLRMIMMRSTSR